MSTRRLVVAAVVVFVLAWGVLMVLAMWRSPPPETVPGEPAAAPASRRLGGEEIARHNRPEDCWLVIRGKVYDVTRYIDLHPAPRRTITDHCGKESTSAFETKERGRPHSARAWRLLDAYLIGEAHD
jgi:cytochrome b involved in lipid metabolism